MFFFTPSSFKKAMLKRIKNKDGELDDDKQDKDDTTTTTAAVVATTNKPPPVNQ